MSDCVPVILFDPVIFREQFPAFANPTTYPDAKLEMYWDQATCYVSDLNYGWLRDKCRRLAIDMMTAHLLALSILIAAGQTPNIVQGSTIDKISVTLKPPETPDQWAWWLNTTPYGMELLALLQVRSAGGWYTSVGCGEVGAFYRPGWLW